MMNLRPSIEVCSLSLLGDLIQSDRPSATTIFSRLCGLDLQTGQEAIETFRQRSKHNLRLPQLLATMDHSTIQAQPESLMKLLTEGFGLSELDTIDIVLRLSKQSTFREGRQGN